MLLGSSFFSFLASCSSPPGSDESSLPDKDSLEALRRQELYDDSVKEALLKHKQDSSATADSIKKANQQNQNPYKPTVPTTKYGVRPINKNDTLNQRTKYIPSEPVVDYGVPVNYPTPDIH
jgi:hypothetical protein